MAESNVMPFDNETYLFSHKRALRRTHWLHWMTASGLDKMMSGPQYSSLTALAKQIDIKITRDLNLYWDYHNQDGFIKTYKDIESLLAQSLNICRAANLNFWPMMWAPLNLLKTYPLKTTHGLDFQLGLILMTLP